MEIVWFEERVILAANRPRSPGIVTMTGREQGEEMFRWLKTRGFGVIPTSESSPVSVKITTEPKWEGG